MRCSYQPQTLPRTPTLLIYSRLQLDCITSAVFNSTCGPTDMPCICANPTLQGQAQQCVLASCTIRQQLSMFVSSPFFHLQYALGLVSNTFTRVATVNIINGQCGIVSGHDRSWVPPMMFFVIFAGIIFVLRLVSRIYCHTKFWWDDFFNLLGAVSLPPPRMGATLEKVPN
jgi:hypothetical protein